MAVERKPTARGLSDRDRKVIDHVARYRLTTIPVLTKTALHGLSSNAVAKIANRLTSAGYLQKFTLLHPARYFMLGSKGAAMLGRTGRPGMAPGSQSLPTDYGVLVYATLGKQSRLRMARSEVTAVCPWLPDRLASAPHCYDDEKKLLELIRVDLGGSPGAANLFGSSARGLPSVERRDHDLRLAAVYFHYRKTRPELVSGWIANHARLPNQELTRNPDAVLLDARRRITRVIESAGDWNASQINAFHEFCFANDLPYELW